MVRGFDTERVSAFLMTDALWLGPNGLAYRTVIV